MSFRITGLDPAAFARLFALDDAALEAHAARRVLIEQPNSAPCRVTLEDARPGERVLLVNHEHQPADTPYRARHAIFVREGVLARFDRVDEVPGALRRRTLSLRAFDAGHMMIDASLTEGGELESALEIFFAKPDIAYVQLHYATRGCYAAHAERA